MGASANANLVPDKGDCYESSFLCATEFNVIKFSIENGPTPLEGLQALYHQLGLRAPIEIVHGWVTSPSGPCAGRRLHHAWVEVGCKVFETQGGTRARYDKAIYYEIFKAAPNQRYTLTEVEEYVKAGGDFFGAWRGKGQDPLNLTNDQGAHEYPPEGFQGGIKYGK